MKSPDGELTIWTVLWAAGGAFLCYLAFRDARLGFAIVYAALTAASVCLWFGVRQIEWLLVACFAAATLDGLILLVNHVSYRHATIQIAVWLYSIYLLARWNSTQPDDEVHPVRLSRKARSVLAYLQSPEGQAEIERRSREREEVCRWKVMVELPSGQEITGEEIAQKASVAFNCRFTARFTPLDPVDAAFLANAENGPLVDGAAPHFLCGLPPYLFEIIQVDRFLLVNYLPSATFSEELENGYRWTAKLAAEFISLSPATVMLGDRRYAAADPCAIAEALRSPAPEAALALFSVP